MVFVSLFQRIYIYLFQRISLIGQEIESEYQTGNRIGVSDRQNNRSIGQEIESEYWTGNRIGVSDRK